VEEGWAKVKLGEEGESMPSMTNGMRLSDVKKFSILTERRGEREE
jgi:hypothetical protein